MEERLSNLLRIVIDDFIATAEPVGSQAVVDRYKLDVSSATIRNWFATLEEEELLMQPHTSGGRIPTEKGYKLYIDQFVREKPASKKEREALEKAALVANDHERKLKQVVKALAELSGLAAFAGLGNADTYYTGLSQLFSQPEFREAERVINLSEVLDHLDEALSSLRTRSIQSPQILLGTECPFGPSCGVLIAQTNYGLIGILGPMRMDYQQNYSLTLTALHTLRNE